MLSDVLPRIAILERRGAPDVRLASATHDSRLVEQGTLFAAIPGTVVDGHRFIPQALAAGASAVLLRDWPPGDLPDDVAWLRVADPRRALALAASQFHGRPSQDMSVFAITGTNGKTTTVSILAPISAPLRPPIRRPRDRSCSLTSPRCVMTAPRQWRWS
jgi:UDP-N-acetylmuramoyl-L-alanyl-D-glutamate--2,6-diaminopimelate ligase